MASSMSTRRSTTELIARGYDIIIELKDLKNLNMIQGPENPLEAVSADTNLDDSGEMPTEQEIDAQVEEDEGTDVENDTDLPLAA